MSRRDNDIVPILIDTKNEMKRAIDGLDQRVGELDRELRTTLRGALAELRSGPLADLKTSQREIRTSAGNAGRSAGDAAAAVAELRDDIGRLRCGFEVLQGHVAELRSLLPAVVEPVGGPAGREQHGLGSVGPADGGGPDPRATHLAVVPPQAESPAEESLPPDRAAADDTGQEAGADARRSEPAAESPGPEAVPLTGAASDAAPPTADGPARPAEESGTAGAPEDAAPDAATVEVDTLDTRSPGGERVGPHDGEGSGEQPQGDRPDRPCWELEGDEPRVYTTGGLQRAILRASKVASATLTCHADTWEFVTSKTGGHPHFRTPPTAETDGGLVAAQLSGRSLVALLLTLHRVAVTPLETGCDEDLVKRSDWAMAAQVYGTTAEVLRHTLTDGTAPVVITIDNRLHNLP
ncbi:hypothetical protein [Streptomyces lonarensis]|uniref:Uncharacterized protein n=1 Tax=Streptomyces lonarensis TaxID=700599 RepID=A0A7X6CZF6_9ACTN|nr:hypothetical protein [Streptomyces lonarensis]NJQ05243.1 hypothetical protein [Streptomyces lonarensis]